MKYIDADHLKAEIEKHIKGIKDAAERFTPNLGFFDAKLSGIYDVTAIIDSLQQEQTVEKTSYETQKYTPSPFVSIEDVARVQFASHAKVFDKKRKAVFDWEQFKEVVGIFYSFGKKDSIETKEKEQPLEGLEEEIKKYIEEYGYERGEDKLLIAIVARHFAEWQKAKMMEKAAEGEYGYFSNASKTILPSGKLNLKEGDKVRILILKAEEE